MYERDLALRLGIPLYGSDPSLFHLGSKTGSREMFAQAGVAYPAYQRQVLRSNRTEAKAMLTDAVARQERFFSNNNAYTTDMTALGYLADPAVTENLLYSVDALAATVACPLATCFAMQATAQNRQLNDGQCRTFTLDSLSQKASADSAAAPNNPVPNDPCW